VTDCDACLHGDHSECVGAGCGCFERTCAAAEAAARRDEKRSRDQGVTFDYVAAVTPPPTPPLPPSPSEPEPVYVPSTFDRWVLRWFGRAK